MIHTRTQSDRPRPAARTRRSASRAFTLLEIMFAIMILGIGLVAVAALFPVTTRLQKSTFDDMIGMQIVSNVEALLNARGLKANDLPPALEDGQVHRVPAELIDDDPDNGPNPDSIEWVHELRSFPDSIPATGQDDIPIGSPDGYDDGLASRPYWWEPLVRYEPTTGQWEVYVIIFRSIGQEVPPVDQVPARTGSLSAPYTLTNVTSPEPSDPAAGVFYPGEMIIDNYGNFYTVVSMPNPTTIELDHPPASNVQSVWHARGRGKTRTTIRIFQLTGVVQ